MSDSKKTVYCTLEWDGWLMHQDTFVDLRVTTLKDLVTRPYREVCRFETSSHVIVIYAHRWLSASLARQAIYDVIIRVCDDDEDDS